MKNVTRCYTREWRSSAKKVFPFRGTFLSIEVPVVLIADAR